MFRKTGTSALAHLTRAPVSVRLEVPLIRRLRGKENARERMLGLENKYPGTDLGTMRSSQCSSRTTMARPTNSETVEKKLDYKQQSLQS